MRFNKSEVLRLAVQLTHRCDKEGLLLLRDRTDGFFRRTDVFRERWCRLCGNLLFYLKTKEPWSEPTGLIVLESSSVSLESTPLGSTEGYHFQIKFPSGGNHWFCAETERERASWLEALQDATFVSLRAKVELLRDEVNARTQALSQSGYGHNPTLKASGYVTDVSEAPLCEVSFSCDNLLCDSHGRAPNPRVVIHLRNSSKALWLKYACTEIVTKSSNPSFLRTVTFRTSDGLDDSRTEVRISVWDVRERTSSTETLVGDVAVPLAALRGIQRLRLPLSAGTAPRPPGFVSIALWNLEREERSSTESTPSRPHAQVTTVGVETTKSLQPSHRRTQSLPPRLGGRLKVPRHFHLGELFANPVMATYRFHSGLGGDIFVHEIMAEPRLAFLLPQQLLAVWIAEEKELLQEMMGVGEVREPWNTRQRTLFQRHLALIHMYTEARQQLTLHRGGDFKPSMKKGDPTHEFVPLNLHLQRIWGQNESLHKNGFHDSYSVGAFTAYAQGFEGGGLLRRLQGWQSLCERQGRSLPSSYMSNKVRMTYDAVQGIKRLRREIVERMQVIMKLAKERKAGGMTQFVEEIYHRCRLLLSISDESLIEEAFDFLERERTSLPRSTATDLDFLEEFPLRMKSGDSASGAIGADEGVETPTSPLRSFLDMIRRKREEEKEGEDKTPDSGLGLEDVVRSFLDSASSNYYGGTEEPEPWDLTLLNIEASVISLNSKVRVLCGTTERYVKPPRAVYAMSMTLNGHGHSVPKNSASWRKSLREEPSGSPGRLKVNNNVVSGCNGSSAEMQESIAASVKECDTAALDWTEELRGSVKKLRLALDSLLKTSRLAHSIFRVQESAEKSELGSVLKYRRDVCFSHALTSLVSGLMGTLWCGRVDATWLHLWTRLGPLVTFHSFLSYVTSEAEMLNDMMVAVEDLRSVEFVLIPRDKGGGLPCPKIVGSRATLQVLLPVPETVLRLAGSRSTSFVVTPILFNIGINQAAGGAPLEPQHKSNLDNFQRLHDYVRRVCKLALPLSLNSKRSNISETSVDQLMDILHSQLLQTTKKNVEVIHLSAQITRRLHGLRFTSCKSGKDRTSMAVTFEQVQLLSDEYDLAETEFTLALDAMRSEGTRRENTMKNIGERKYAFTLGQTLALPLLYQPPPGTYGNVQT